MEQPSLNLSYETNRRVSQNSPQNPNELQAKKAQLFHRRPPESKLPKLNVEYPKIRLKTQTSCKQRKLSYFIGVPRSQNCRS
ncbi:hypothetical protein C2E31_11320 [Rhodopirellula baltica]|nr:hypothetical protein C2E31_11320 [Rhodopirellula baltica]